MVKFTVYSRLHGTSCSICADASITFSQLFRSALKKHAREYPVECGSGVDLVCCVKLFNNRILRDYGRAIEQLQNGDSIWLVSDKDWHEFIEPINRSDAVPRRHGRPMPFHQPSSLSREKLESFILGWGSLNESGRQSNASNAGSCGSNTEHSNNTLSTPASMSLGRHTPPHVKTTPRNLISASPSHRAASQQTKLEAAFLRGCMWVGPKLGRLVEEVLRQNQSTSPSSPAPADKRETARQLLEDMIFTEDFVHIQNAVCALCKEDDGDAVLAKMRHQSELSHIKRVIQLKEEESNVKRERLLRLQSRLDEVQILMGILKTHPRQQIPFSISPDLLNSSLGSTSPRRNVSIVPATLHEPAEMSANSSVSSPSQYGKETRRVFRNANEQEQGQAFSSRPCQEAGRATEAKDGPISNDPIQYLPESASPGDAFGNERYCELGVGDDFDGDFEELEAKLSPVQPPNQNHSPLSMYKLSSSLQSPAIMNASTGMTPTLSTPRSGHVMNTAASSPPSSSNHHQSTTTTPGVSSPLSCPFANTSAIFLQSSPSSEQHRKPRSKRMKRAVFKIPTTPVGGMRTIAPAYPQDFLSSWEKFHIPILWILNSGGKELALEVRAGRVGRIKGLLWTVFQLFGKVSDSSLVVRELTVAQVQKLFRVTGFLSSFKSSGSKDGAGSFNLNMLDLEIKKLLSSLPKGKKEITFHIFIELLKRVATRLRPDEKDESSPSSCSSHEMEREHFLSASPKSESIQKMYGKMENFDFSIFSEHFRRACVSMEKQIHASPFLTNSVESRSEIVGTMKMNSTRKNRKCVRSIWRHNLEPMLQIFRCYGKESGFFDDSGKPLEKVLSFEASRLLLSDFNLTPRFIDYSWFRLVFISVLHYELWNLGQLSGFESDVFPREGLDKTNLSQGQGSDDFSPLTSPKLSALGGKHGLAVHDEDMLPDSLGRHCDFTNAALDLNISFIGFLELLSRVATHCNLGSSVRRATDNLLRIMEESGGKGKMVSLRKCSVRPRRFVLISFESR
jgi:hypothetical protein